MASTSAAARPARKAQLGQQRQGEERDVHGAVQRDAERYGALTTHEAAHEVGARAGQGERRGCRPSRARRRRPARRPRASSSAASWRTSDGDVVRAGVGRAAEAGQVGGEHPAAVGQRRREVAPARSRSRARRAAAARATPVAARPPRAAGSGCRRRRRCGRSSAPGTLGPALVRTDRSAQPRRRPCSTTARARRVARR